MKINELRNIHSWVRNTGISEILFVSSLILPAYLLLYNYALTVINESWRNAGLVIAVIIYAAGIFWMKNSQSVSERNHKDLLIIKNFILDKGYKYMTFERLLEIDKKYNEDKVKSLMFHYPNEIRLAKLKDNKRGIKILTIEEE